MREKVVSLHTRPTIVSCNDIICHRWYSLMIINDWSPIPRTDCLSGISCCPGRSSQRRGSI